MKDAAVNQAVRRFHHAMTVIDETLPIIQEAHLDDVPSIAAIIARLNEVQALRAELDSRCEAARVELSHAGININDASSAIGAALRRLVGR